MMILKSILLLLLGVSRSLPSSFPPLAHFAVPVTVDQQTYFLVVDATNVSLSDAALATAFCDATPIIPIEQGCVARLTTGVARYRAGYEVEAAQVIQRGPFEWTSATRAELGERLLLVRRGDDSSGERRQCEGGRCGGGGDGDDGDADGEVPYEVTIRLQLRPRDLERYVRTSTQRAIHPAVLAAAIVAEHRLPAYALADVARQLAATPPPLRAARTASAIPRIFHQIWLGDGEMPAKFRAYSRSWRTHHPGWELKMWTDANLPPLVNQELFDSVTEVRERADLLRYELLYRYGGVYVDTDFECFKSIEPLLHARSGEEGGEESPPVSAFSSQESPEHISIGIMGATQGNAFFGRIVDNLPRWHATHSGPEWHIGYRTGPFLIRSAYALWPGELTLLPQWALYPYHSTNFEARGKNATAFPNAYAAHHWQFDV